MNILVLGAGLQGCAAAYDLLQVPSVTRVTLADLNPARLPKFLQKDWGSRLKPLHDEFASNIDLIDVLPPGLYEAVMTPKEEASSSDDDLIGGNYLVRFEARTLDDIRAHLSLPSPWKPTAWLLEADRLVSIGEVPEFGLRLPDQSEGGAADALAQLIYGRARRDGDPTLEEMRRVTLNALVVGDHPQAAPIFDAVLASPRPNPHAIGLALRFFSKHGQYRRAFEWIETKLMASRAGARPYEPYIGR